MAASKLSRRRLLIGGGAAAAALAAAGALYGEMQLADGERAIIAAIAPVMLGIPGSGARVVLGVDVAVEGLPLETRAQLRRLMALLRFPPSRIFVAGVRRPWHAANQADIAAFLHGWRYSSSEQLRSAYDALHQLIMAAWYGNSDVWPAIGYAGPPRLA